MNIYHKIKSHTLLTCKSHTTRNEEAGKYAGYNNELLNCRVLHTLLIIMVQLRSKIGQKKTDTRYHRED